MPAPISPSAAAFSNRTERMPFCASPSAAARPPMPPPAISTGRELSIGPAPEMFERILRPQRHARGLVVEIDQLRQERQQRLAVRGLQRLQHPCLRAIDARDDVTQQCFAGLSQIEQL